MIETQEPVVLPVMQSSRTNEIVAGVAVPIVDQRATTIGLVRISFTLDELAAQLASAAPTRAPALFLVDPSGRIAVHTARPTLSWEERDISSWPEFQAALSGQSVELAAFESPLFDEPRVLAMTRTPRYGWVAATSLRAAEAFAPLEQAFRWQIVSFGVVAALSALGAIILGNVLVGPVGRLIRQARALGRGDLSRRVDIRSGDELEALGQEFNAMADQLQSALKEVTTRADELGAIATAARAIVREIDLEAVAHAVVDEARSSLATEQAVLWLISPDAKELRLISHIGLSAQRAEELRCLPISAGLPAAKAARTVQTVVVEDLLTTREFPMTREAVERGGLRSVLCLPLAYRERLVGVLAVASGRPRRFGSEHVRLAAALGDLFAAAVENARLYDQVRESLRIREEFLAAAAHELRTPATAVKGYVQLLQRHGPRSPLEERALAHIDQAGDRIARLASQIEELHAQADMGKRLQLAPIDLTALVEERVALQQASSDQHRLLVCAEGPLVVVADAARLTHAIDALLENAMEAEAGGGRIRVFVAREGNEATVTVQDFGAGIPGERLPHVFEPLYQPWPPGSPYYVGTARLGLHVAHRVLEAHGGTIEAQSEVGKGSTFRLRLPLSGPAEVVPAG